MCVSYDLVQFFLQLTSFLESWFLGLTNVEEGFRDLQRLHLLGIKHMAIKGTVALFWSLEQLYYLQLSSLPRAGKHSQQMLCVALWRRQAETRMYGCGCILWNHLHSDAQLIPTLLSFWHREKIFLFFPTFSISIGSGFYTALNCCSCCFGLYFILYWCFIVLLKADTEELIVKSLWKLYVRGIGFLKPLSNLKNYSSQHSFGRSSE